MDMGMAAANQHKVLEEGRGLHPDSYIRSGRPLVQRQKILYINGLY